MKANLQFWSILLLVLFGLMGLSERALAQTSYTLTYSQGDIGGPADYTLATPTSCPGSMTFNNIPLGMRVDSVRVSYNFFTSMAGFGNPSMQRSYLRCPTTGVHETQLTAPSGAGVGTTNSYARTVSIANGVVTGPLTLELHCGSADPLSFSACGSSYNSVLNNSWSVTVYTSSGIPSFVPTNGLIAYYPFNGSPNDATTGNNHLTTYGGVSLTTDRSNTPNSAYGFDGVDDYLVDTPSFTMSQTGSFTYSVWMRKDSLVGLTLMHGNSTTNNFVTLIGGSSQVQFGTNQQGSSWIWANAPLTLGSWDHYVCTYNGVTKAMQIFRNGQLAGTATYTYTAAVAAVQPLFVGRGIGGAGTYFKGKIDDIGIWNRTLTTQEIIALYTGGGRDARIQAITAPQSLVQGNNFLSVRIQNSGSDTIRTAQLSYRINQGTPVTTSHTFSPPLAPTDTLIYTFATPFNSTGLSNAQMQAWVSNANGLGADLNPGNDTASATACLGLSGTYTVGAGGQYPNLQAAFTDLTNCGASSAVTLNLLPGTYTGNFTPPTYLGSGFGLSIGSSSSNPGDVLVINGGSGHTFDLTGRSNITLRDITIRITLPATLSAAISCVNTSGGSNITLLNCRIIADSISTSSFNRPVTTLGTDNFTVQGCTILNGYYGVYSSATSPAYSLNNRLIDNTFREQYYYGVFQSRMRGLVFNNNTVNSTRAGNASSYAVYVATSKGVIISGNKLQGTFGAYGYYFSNLQMDTAANLPVRMFNNMLTATFTSTTAPRAVYNILSTTDGLDALEMAHNSFEVRSALTSATVAGVITFFGSTTANTAAYLSFRNNSISLLRTSGTGVGTSLMYYYGQNVVANTVANNNLYYFDNLLTGSLFKQWTSTATNSLTLTAWQTATAQDLSSLTSNPQYTSSSNLMPLSISPLRNAGMVISWVVSDINGTPRDNNPDIGAYEVVVAAGDIVALRMVSPAGNQLIAGQNYQVSYRLLNGGGTALTSAILSYQWGSSPVVTNNFNGSVQPGDSITYTFTGPGITAPMAGSQTLKVWSSGPNSVADANPGNDTLSTAYCIPLSGTYTVGGTGSNFPTIDSALTYIGGCGISGPLTLSLTSGTYTGSWNIGSYQGSSFGITVTSSTGNASDVVVSNTGNGNTIRFTNTSNISLYNLTISNPVLPSSGSVASACVEISNSSNITISNCILKGDPTSTSSNNRSIYINTGTNLNISGNQIMNSYYGIYFSATSPDFNSNIQIVGNQFSNIYYYYLYMNRMNNLSVTANTFSNASGGFTPYYGFYVLASNGVAFRENQVYGTLNAYGWYFSSINGSASNPNMLVNNVFSCEFTSTTPRALYLAASTTDGLDYLELHHNSFEGRFLSSSTTANGLIYLTGGSATAPAMSRLIMRNNIFRLVRSSGTFSATGIYYFAGSYLIDSTLSNYNLFQFEGQGTSPLHRNASTNYNSLADWRTATGDDLNSIDGNPLFAGINNLTPSSLSPARNAGTPSFVTTDVAGNLRDANPDMGAYEIQLGAADVYVQRIINPSGIVQPATTYPVTVRIINGSLNPLLNVRLTYQLGNATPVVQNFALSLQSGDTAQLTFSQNITSSTSSTQSLVVWSSLPNGINDANPTNDTARTLLCQALNAGTYTVGNQGSANYASFADLFEVLGCGGINGPVTILLNAANNLWNEQVIVPFIPGAGPNSPLVIDAQGDTITSGSSARSLATLSFNNSHNVIVRNAVIKATGTANGVLFVNADSCSLVANTIICDTTSTSSTVNAVVTSGALNSVTSNSLCNSLLIDSNLIVGGYYGMRIYGDANIYNANNRISNNRIQDFYVYGIYTYYQDGLGIIDNDVSRPNRSTTSTFYGNYNLYSLGGTFKNNKIHNGFDKNPTTTSTAYGLYIGSSPSTGSRPNLVYNNILYNFNTTGTIYGLYNSANSNTDWYHNTAIFDHQVTGTGAVYAVYFTGTGTNNDFKNNLVYVSRAGTGTKYGMYMPSTGTGLNSDNNNIAVVATAGTNYFGYNGSAIATLTAWRTASQNAWDMNSTDANPLFANTSSLPIVPTNWVMNNIGENLGSLVTTDLAGLTRSLTPDPGAYEYTVNGCFGLVNLRADNVQAYSARVLWASAASQWELEYGLAGFAQGSGTSISLSQGSVILNNLLPNTAYQVYVREAGCSSGPGAWSTLGFTTRRDYDLSAVDLIAPSSGQCTNSSLPVRMVVANTGLLPMTGYTGRVRVSGPTNATITASSSVVLAPGQKDTLLVGNLNLFPGRLASFEVSVSNPSDLFRFNDTLDIDKEFIGVDAGQDTTITPGDTATLNARIYGFASSSVLNASPGANNGSAGVTFNVRALQTAYIDTIYTNIYGTLGNPATVDLWYRPSAINGTPNISIAGGWTQIHSAYPTTVGNSTTSNALANTAIPLPAGFNIPAGSTYGFFVTVASGGNTAYKTHVTGSVDTFANNAIVISTGPNVGYGGSAPAPVNHPRQFCGAVSVRNRAVVQWTAQGSSTVLGTGNTLRVAPALTTTYVATLVDSLCPTSDAVTVFSGTINEITGLFRYNNTAQTAMTNSTVQLKDPQNVIIMSAPTSSTGSYILSPVAAGNYTLTGITNKPWGGVNSVDALGISRSFTGAAPLVGLRLKAADVNGSNTVNSLDALTTSRRFSGSVTSFTVGNWAIENLPVAFNSGTITRNLLGVCYGDVNGSYSPSTALRIDPKIRLLAQGSVTTDNHRKLRNWAWQADRPITLGALSLVLTLPEGVQVDAMRSRMMDGNFDYHQNGRELRISWYSLEENHKHAGDPLFEMDLSNVPNEGIAPSDLLVEELSEAASPLAEVYDLTTLRIPVIASRNGAECTVYPNPSFGKSLLRLVAPEHGNCAVRIVDAQGRLMTAESTFELTNGINELSLPTEGLADGLYSVQVVYSSLANKGLHGAFIKTLPLTIRK